MLEQTATKATLDGTPTTEQNSLYLVDFSKMNSVNDLVVILSAMGISFAGSHPHFEVVKPFLNLNNPIKLPPQPNAPEVSVKKEFSLPKLKQL